MGHSVNSSRRSSAAVVVEQVQLPVEVLRERRDLQRPGRAFRRATLRHVLYELEAAGAVRRERGDHAAEVAEHVVARDLRRLQAAVDVSARDRESEVVIVLRDRIDEVLPSGSRSRARSSARPRGCSSRSCRRARRCRSLPSRPGRHRRPRVRRSGGRSSSARDCGSRARRSPGRPAPRCHRRCRAGWPANGLPPGAGRHAVRRAARPRIDVDAQHLAEQALRVLAVSLRIAGTAAVAERRCRGIRPDRRRGCRRCGCPPTCRP